MTVVIDSNILLSSVLPLEALQQQAKLALLTWEDAGLRLVAPRLFRSEITAVIRKAVFQKRITHEEGKVRLLQFFKAEVEFFDDDALHIAAYEIAARFNLPRAYDSQYLALAERLDCDFWTTDEKLFNSIQPIFRHIRWLGSFIP